MMPRLGDGNEAGHGRRDSHDHVSEELHFDRIYTVQPRRLLVDTHSLGIELEVGELQNQHQDPDEESCQIYRGLNRITRDDAADLISQVVGEYRGQFEERIFSLMPKLRLLDRRLSSERKYSGVSDMQILDA